MYRLEVADVVAAAEAATLENKCVTLMLCEKTIQTSHVIKVVGELVVAFRFL